MLVSAAILSPTGEALSHLSIEEEALITVDKRRVEGLLDEHYLVSVDEVDGLGHFVEIEATKDFGSVNETRNALQGFAVKALGLSLDVVDHKGYPHLLLEKRAAEQSA